MIDGELVIATAGKELISIEPKIAEPKKLVIKIGDWYRYYGGGGTYREIYIVSLRKFPAGIQVVYKYRTEPSRNSNSLFPTFFPAWQFVTDELSNLSKYLIDYSSISQVTINPPQAN